MPLNSSEEKKVETEVLSERAGNPVWLGMKLMFADVGSTSLLAVVILTINILTGISVTGTMTFVETTVFGLAISVYIAFLLYRKYSTHTTAFIALLLTGCFVSGTDLLMPHSTGTKDVMQSLVLGASNIIAYVFGWYLAKSTTVKVFYFGRKWITSFAVIGMISTAISVVSLLASLRA